MYTIEPTFAAQEWPAMPRAAITVAELECGAYTVKPRHEKKHTRLPKELPGDAAGNFDGTQWEHQRYIVLVLSMMGC